MTPDRYKDFRLAHFPEHGALGGERTSLFIGGQVGRGKTALGCAILAAWGEPRGFVGAADLLLELESARRFGSVASVEEACDKYAKMPALLIDDLGTERQSDANWSLVFTILSRRMDANLPTIITSNKSPDEFDDRMASRLSTFRVVVMRGADLRRQPKPIEAVPEQAPASPFKNYLEWWLGLTIPQRQRIGSVWAKFGRDPWPPNCRLVNARNVNDIGSFASRCQHCYDTALAAATANKVTLDIWLRGA